MDKILARIDALLELEAKATPGPWHGCSIEISAMALSPRSNAEGAKVKDRFFLDMARWRPGTCPNKQTWDLVCSVHGPYKGAAPNQICPTCKAARPKKKKGCKRA